MLIVFFDIQGIADMEFVPSGQAVDHKFYCELLKLLREGIGTNIQTSGRTAISFPTMTKRPLTHHPLFGNS
jgi:hypothetical protein